MNSNVDHSKFSDIFGDGEQSGDDVSLESALNASKMPKKQVKKVKVWDTELGWVEEFVTVDAPTFKIEGTLREAVQKYGHTFPENVVVTFTNWNGTQRIMSVDGDIERGSVYIIEENGNKSTFNPLENVEVVETETAHTITAADGDTVDLGDLTIRVVITPVYSGGEDELDIQVYGWRNNDPAIDNGVFVGDCEVEVAMIRLPDDGDFRTGTVVTFTLTQKQVDDALALYDDWYMSEES